MARVHNNDFTERIDDYLWRLSIYPDNNVILQWIFGSSLRKPILLPEKLVCGENPCKSQET